MRPRRAIEFLIGASSLGFVGLFAYHLLGVIDHSAEAAYARDLRAFEAVDARLNEDLLRSRSGLVAHYDTLVADLAELWRLRRAAAHVPESVRAERDQFLEELQQAGALLARKDDLLERFRTQHSTLRNSRHVVPVIASRLTAQGASDPSLLPLTQAVAEVLTALLRLDLNPLASHAPFELELSTLERVRPLARRAGVEQDLKRLVDHVRIVDEHEGAVDALVRDALGVPLDLHVQRLADLHTRGYRAALAAAALRARLLTALGIAAIVLGLGAVISRLRASELAEHRATAYERGLRKLQASFFAMTSHEFRTPLSAILSSSQLLMAYSERWDGARRRTHLERIEKAARDLGRLHEQIQLIGRGQAGALAPASSEVDLRALCRELCESERQACAGTHPIRSRYSGPPRVDLDERLLAHILRNLLENAVKYSPPESEVALDVLVDDQEYLFRVSDAGIGVPAADQAFLFDSFYRASNVGVVPGSGLGLAVVKHAVMAQGGEIEVESEAGQGTTFSIRLPRSRRAGAHAEPGPGPAPLGA